MKPAVESKKVAEISKTVVNKKVVEKSENQWLKAKKFLKNLKISGWKLKSWWKIFKPAVESKKVAEIFENGCKQKVAEKSENSWK